MKDLLLLFWQGQYGSLKEGWAFLKGLKKINCHDRSQVCSLAQQLNLSPNFLDALRDTQATRRITAYYQAQGIRLVTVLDRAYPACLKSMAYPPLVLTYRGDLSLLNRQRLTLLSEEQLSFSAHRLLEDVLTNLKGPILVGSILSNLTALTYEKTLDTSLRMVLILSSGFLAPYPLKHLFMLKHAQSHQLVISELPAQQAFSKTYLTRHRELLAGLSSLVFLLEASKDSMNLFTAHRALDQNKDILVAPGGLYDQAHQGSNSLIQEGAALYLTWQDVLDLLP